MGFYSSIPVIKRARGYRLYDMRGKRIIDLYQQNGHAILGHRAFSLTTLLKNIISKGLIFDLPSIYTHRLKKAVKAMIPGVHTVCIAGSLDQGLRLLSEALGYSVALSDICDPVIGNTMGPIALWRPFAGDIPQNAHAQILLPVLPFSAGGAPVVICLNNKKIMIDDNLFPPLSPFILAGTIRALYDLKKYKKPEWLNEDMLSGAGKWEQQGIYLIPKMNEEEYKGVFEEFLAHGILLSPCYPCPSIFPGELSEGELKKVLRLLRGA